MYIDLWSYGVMELWAYLNIHQLIQTYINISNYLNVHKYINIRLF